MLVVTVALGGQRSLSLAACSHVTFLLFKQRLFAPSPLISVLLFPSPFSASALIFNSVVRREGATCVGYFFKAGLEQG